MARTEDQNQDAGSPEKLITKSLPCENPHEVHGFVILGEGESEFCHYRAQFLSR